MKKDIFLKRLGESAVTLSVAALIVKIIGVVYKVPLTYILGVEGMGYFNSAYTVYGFFYTVCSAGIPKAITIYIKRCESEGEKNAGEGIYRISMRAFGIFGLSVTFIYILLAKPLTALIGNSAALYSTLAIGPSIFFVVLGGVARGYLTVRSGLFDIAISQLIEALSKLGLGLYFAYIGYRLSMPLPLISAFSILGITLGSVLSLIYLSVRIKITKPKNKIRQKTHIQTNSVNKKSVLSGILRLALPITFSASLLSVSSVIDLGIIMRRLEATGLDEATASAEYGSFTTLAVPMLMLVVSVITPLCVPLLPRLTELACLGSSREFGLEFEKVVLKISAVCIPSAFCFFLFPFDILDLLFTSQASVRGAELLALLSPSVIILPILTAVNTALEAKGRIRSTVASLLLGAVVKSVLASLLIGFPDIGIRGAAISTSVSYLSSFIYSSLALGDKTLCAGLYRTVLPVFALTAISYIPAYLLIYTAAPSKNSLLGLLLSGGAGTALFASLMLFYVLVVAKSTALPSFCTKTVGKY